MLPITLQTDILTSLVQFQLRELNVAYCLFSIE